MPSPPDGHDLALAVPPAGGVPPRALALRLILPIVVVGLLAAAVALGWHRALSLDALLGHRANLGRLVAAHPLAAMGTFAALYVVVVALSIPGAVVLTVASGLLFGVLVGSCLSVVGATAGAVLLFLLARSALGEPIRRRAGPRVQRLAAGFRRDAFNYILFLRLAPVIPFWLANLAPAFFDVRLRTFAAATALGIVPGTIAFAFVGAGLDSAAAGLAEGERLDALALATPEVLAALVALAALALVPVVARAVLRRTS